jgi:cytosine/adenosine deaminase-related metal-dependent hydrolase
MSHGADTGNGGSTLHRARFVVPIAEPPIADGAVLVADRSSADGGAVLLAVGRYADLAGREAGARTVDHGEAVLLPPLVNAHTHLELSALGEGRIPAGLDFADWLEAVTRAAGELTEREARPAIEAAIEESLAAGTGLLGDISDTGRAVEPLVRSPLAAHVFHEVIAFDPRQAESVLAVAQSRLQAAEAVSQTRSPIRHSLAPHAPHTVSMRLLRLIRGVNGRAGRPTSMHVAESPAEEEFFRTGGGPLERLKERFGTSVSGWEAPGESPVVYLSRIGWFEAPQLLVHATQITARGIEILRRAPVTVCLCPRSNRTLAVGTAPAHALATAGVPLALGTDSRASVDSLSIFDELAAAHADYGLPPEVLLEAATRGGARALGFGDAWGELVAGRPAAVIAVAAPSGTRLDDPFSLLLGAPRPEAITWIAGAGAGAGAGAAGARSGTVTGSAEVRHA